MIYLFLFHWLVSFIILAIVFMVASKSNITRIIIGLVGTIMSVILILTLIKFGLIFEPYIPTNQFRAVYSEDEGLVIEREYQKEDKLLNGPPKSKWKLYTSLDD